MLVPELHVQPVPRCGDGHVPVSQSPHQVEGLTRRLLERESQGVLLDILLDGLSYLRRGPEEAVRRHQASYSLVWPLEVVRLDEERHPPLAVGEVGEHRAREKLVPQRLPEALRLPQRHRMLRAALDVTDAVLLEQRLEGRLPAPRRVLPPVVSEHLAWRAVRGDSSLERFDDQRCLVVVREDVRHDEARVVVEERRHVELLVASQPELEDVRLPHLVRLGALEAALRWWRLRHRRPLLRQQPRLMQDAPNLRRRHAQCLEASQAVGDFPRPEVRERLLHCHHCVSRRTYHRSPRLGSRLAEAQPGLALLAVALQPHRHRLVGDAEQPRHRVRRDVFLDDLLHDPQPELRRIATAIRATGLSSLRSASLSHCRSSSRCALGLNEEKGAMDFGARSAAHQLARTTLGTIRARRAA